MYIKTGNGWGMSVDSWAFSQDQKELRERYPYVKTISIYANEETRNMLKDDVVIEVAIDNMLDWFDDNKLGETT